MADLDPAQLLVHLFRDLLAHFNHHDAYNLIKDQFPGLCQVVRNRSLMAGDIPTVQLGDEFAYRYELMLVGLHNHPVRGICIGSNLDGAAVCTCAVAKFPLHNYPEGEFGELFVYGGEGGQLALANSMNVRILEDQDWRAGNLACIGSMNTDSKIRGVILQQRDDGVLVYVYEGLFSVLYFREELTPEGFIVFEFVLTRV